VAAVGFFSTDAINSPYQRPWNWGREDASDQARHEVADSLPSSIAVRASSTMLPLLAERQHVYALDARPSAADATRDVNRVVITAQDVSWTADQWKQFSGGMARAQFVLVYDRDGVKLYTRLSAA
ncbi:MAG TPA: hypothetical protein VGZ52_11630, partial [Acidimicrobiales bacterium]|nr:hypothetical protein [Acidimicrobiales bacterium]